GVAQVRFDLVHPGSCRDYLRAQVRCDDELPTTEAGVQPQLRRLRGGVRPVENERAQVVDRDDSVFQLLRRTVEQVGHLLTGRRRVPNGDAHDLTSQIQEIFGLPDRGHTPGDRGQITAEPTTSHE